MGLKYSMQYLKTANVNLIKDMGMIPYKLHKLYGYDSTVITYKLGEYPYLDNEVKGLKIDFVKKIFHNISIDGGLHLIKTAKKTDVLQIFHCTLSSVVYAGIYKFLNKRGKIYLKLDCSHKLVERIETLRPSAIHLLNMFMNKIDVISVEQEELFIKLKKMLSKHESKFINIPNGIDFDRLEQYNINYSFSEKQNIILNVARIGAEEKNTDMILEAFAKVNNIEGSSWKLKLVGDIDESYKCKIDEFFLEYPHLKDKVEFAGSIIDRRKLYEEYAKAKVFSLTSDFESFGIAFIEAAAFGDILVSTDVGIAKEIVSSDNGILVQKGDIKGLTEAFEQIISDSGLEQKSHKTIKICREKFDWDEIIKRLNDKLMSLY